MTRAVNNYQYNKKKHTKFDTTINDDARKQIFKIGQWLSIENKRVTSTLFTFCINVTYCLEYFIQLELECKICKTYFTVCYKNMITYLYSHIACFVPSECYKAFCTHLPILFHLYSNLVNVNMLENPD